MFHIFVLMNLCKNHVLSTLLTKKRKIKKQKKIEKGKKEISFLCKKATIL